MYGFTVLVPFQWRVLGMKQCVRKRVREGLRIIWHTAHVGASPSVQPFGQDGCPLLPFFSQATVRLVRTSLGPGSH